MPYIVWNAFSIKRSNPLVLFELGILVMQLIWFRWAKRNRGALKWWSTILLTWFSGTKMMRVFKMSICHNWKFFSLGISLTTFCSFLFFLSFFLLYSFGNYLSLIHESRHFHISSHVWKKNNCEAKILCFGIVYGNFTIILLICGFL